MNQDAISHHPHKEVLERLEKIGAKIFITAENGAITASVSNGKLKIKTYID